MTNYPWPMDADVDTLKREMLAFPRSSDPTHYDDLCYLLDRLKLAEAELVALRRSEDNTRTALIRMSRILGK